MSRSLWHALVMGAAFFTSPADADTTVPPGYRQVATAHGVPSKIFYAMALTESGRHIERQGIARPWPWTLNVHGEGGYYPTRHAAAAALREALSRGKDSVDIGLMQVNWRYHGKALQSPEAALDPYRNLNVAATILVRCYRERRDWWEAVGCYHAPNHALRAQRYQERVRGHWKNLQPTENAG